MSAFQADMGCPNLDVRVCTHSQVDWYEFATSQEMIDSGSTYLSGQHPSQVGPGHWELYEQDFDLAADRLSNNALKLTIEWGSMFPVPTDEADGYDQLRALSDPRVIEHYHLVFAALLSRGLKPIVALNQSTLPSWIHDAVGCRKSVGGCLNKGWLDRDRIVKEIAKFAGFVAEEFGPEVDIWVTLSSPYQAMFSGYLWPSWERVNPPALFMQVGEAKAAYASLVEAHARMYDAIKAADLIDADGDGQATFIGLAYALSPARPFDPEDEHDVRAAQDAFYMWNHLFLRAFVHGEFDHDFDGQAEYRPELDDRMDFIGLNYWAVITTVGTPYPAFPELSPLTRFDPLAFGSQYDLHEGIYESLMYLHQEFNLPIIVSENGTVDNHDDGTTPEMLVKRFAWIERAMQDGVDVRGHLFYTLFDCFEWNLGMNRHHGLFAVDESDPDKVRTARKAVEVYDSIVKNRGLTDELSQKYPID